MSQDIGPLDWRIAITDKGGRPTPEFQRRWSTQRNNNALIGTITFGSGPPTGVPADGAEFADTSTDPFTLYIGQGGSWHRAGVSNFTQLSDAPSSYSGAANKIVRVNSSATGLEFDTATANPTAVASDVAVDGSATTFMRSDASPAIQKASAVQFGIVKVDGTTITSDGGVITSIGGGTTSGGTAYLESNGTPGAISTSAFAFKGNIFIPSQEVNMIALWGQLNLVAGGTYQAAICQISGTGGTGLTTVGAPHLSTSVSSATTTTTPVWFRMSFSTPVVLSPGIPYVLLVGRTDQTGAYALPIVSGSVASSAVLPGSFTFFGRIASTTIPAGSTVDTNSSAVSECQLAYEFAATGVPSTGTVTNVGLSAPAEFTVTGSPVTSSGTLSFAKAVQSANFVWSGPASGTAAAPTFRELVVADIPAGLPYDPTGAAAAAQAASLPVGGTAVSASKLAIARSITQTGDASWTVSFDGSANVSSAVTLATVNSTPGSFGSATSVATFTVNAKGLLTASGNTAISYPVTSVFGRTGAVSLTSSDVTTALGFTPGTGNGTVTGVGLSAPPIFSVSGSPITTIGSFAISLVTQTAGMVFCGPVSGAAAAPGFRSLTATDIPTTLNATTINGVTAVGSTTTPIVNVEDNSTNSTSPLIINAPNNGNGANFKFVGNGATTPNKTIRVINGTMQFLNSAYSAVILSLDDSGNLTIPGTTISSGNHTVGGTIISGGVALQPNTTTTLSGGIGSTHPSSPVIQLFNSGGGTDQKYTRLTSTTAGVLMIQGVNDAYTAATQFANFSKTGLVVIGTIQTSDFTVATLPAGVTAARTFVSDSTLPAVGNFGVAPIGGGSNKVPVFFNGTSWLIG